MQPTSINVFSFASSRMLISIWKDGLLNTGKGIDEEKG
jgi:hypothetical protein